MNIFLTLVSFFLGQARAAFKQSSATITQKIVLHARAMATVVVMCLGALAVFCTSLCLLIASIAGQFEKNDDFSFSTVQSIYLLATFISLGVLLFSLRRETWLNIMGYKEATAGPSGSTIENALALLVVDFVESRQAQRRETKDAEKNTRV